MKKKAFFMNSQKTQKILNIIFFFTKRVKSPKKWNLFLRIVQKSPQKWTWSTPHQPKEFIIFDMDIRVFHFEKFIIFNKFWLINFHFHFFDNFSGLKFGFHIFLGFWRNNLNMNLIRSPFLLFFKFSTNFRIRMENFLSSPDHIFLINYSSIKVFEDNT